MIWVKPLCFKSREKERLSTMSIQNFPFIQGLFQNETTSRDEEKIHVVNTRKRPVRLIIEETGCCHVWKLSECVWVEDYMELCKHHWVLVELGISLSTCGSKNPKIKTNISISHSIWIIEFIRYYNDLALINIFIYNDMNYGLRSSIFIRRKIKLWASLHRQIY